MRLVPILFGLLIITGGLATYYGVPSIQTRQTIVSRRLAGPEQITVQGGWTTQRLLNVTSPAGPTDHSRVQLNITVRPMSGDGFTQLELRLANASDPGACLFAASSSSCAYDKIVSNSSIEVALTGSRSFYIVFDNTAWAEPKVVSYSVALRQEEMVQSVTHDNLADWFGLGLGSVGSLIVLFGLTRKTVIPWD